MFYLHGHFYTRIHTLFCQQPDWLKGLHATSYQHKQVQIYILQELTQDEAMAKDTCLKSFKLNTRLQKPSLITCIGIIQNTVKGTLWKKYSNLMSKCEGFAHSTIVVYKGNNAIFRNNFHHFHCYVRDKL